MNETIRICLLAAALLVVGACQPSESGRLSSGASVVATRYAEECDANDAAACYALSLMYRMGEGGFHGVATDLAHADELAARACAAGHELACTAPDGSGLSVESTGQGPAL